MAKRIFTQGERFNKLTFVKELPPLVRRYGNDKRDRHVRIALWKCDCGNERVIDMNPVRNGLTKTCGCLHKAVCKKLLTRHGLYRHPLRYIHRTMVRRCHNEKDAAYHRYGARGIKVCDEWRNSLQDFMIWAIGAGWKPWLTIDRRNNDGNYEPSNCRFVNRTVQANNRRTNHIIEYNGEKMSLADFCRKYNLSYSKTSQRIRKCKWPIEKILATP
jgi:hypothetical protein